MKAIGLTEFGTPDVLTVVDLPEPEPGPGEIRLRVHAAGVNPTDLSFRSGALAARLAEDPLPHVPGVDVAGIVEKLGDNTEDRFAIGDRVIAYVIPFEARKGAYAEQVVVKASSAVAAPRGATLEQAATLLLNGTTARLSLDALDLAAGETLAVIGGAGAVGGYAIQLAKADGLTVIADAAPADEELVRSLGADIVLPRGSDTASAIRARAPEGVPGVIDTAALDAGALPAVAEGGGLVTLKGWAGPGPPGVTIYTISSYGSAADTALFERLRAQAEENVLTFRVADVLPALEAREAHRRLAAGGVRGRLVLDFSQPIGSS